MEHDEWVMYLCGELPRHPEGELTPSDLHIIYDRFLLQQHSPTEWDSILPKLRQQEMQPICHRCFEVWNKHKSKFKNYKEFNDTFFAVVNTEADVQWMEYIMGTTDDLPTAGQIWNASGVINALPEDMRAMTITTMIEMAEAGAPHDDQFEQALTQLNMNYNYGSPAPFGGKWAPKLTPEQKAERASRYADVVEKYQDILDKTIDAFRSLRLQHQTWDEICDITVNAIQEFVTHFDGKALLHPVDLEKMRKSIDTVNATRGCENPGKEECDVILKACATVCEPTSHYDLRYDCVLSVMLPQPIPVTPELEQESNDMILDLMKQLSTNEMSWDKNCGLLATVLEQAPIVYDKKLSQMDKDLLAMQLRTLSMAERAYKPGNRDMVDTVVSIYRTTQQVLRAVDSEFGELPYPPDFKQGKYMWYREL